MKSTARIGYARRFAAALLILVTVALAGFLPAAAQRPNGAGLVVRFGDGSIIYAYVQFEETSITSEELLYRSGLTVAIAPYSGLGAGVCMINGEGCPSDNCFCASYSTPAYFWHFYANDGDWRELLQGASSRSVGDGDIDGWSWTAGDSGLPAIAIDEIASLNGVDRNAPEIPPTETPTLEPTSTSTFTPVPTNTPLPTPTRPTPTIAPQNTATATVTRESMATVSTSVPSTVTSTPTASSSTGQIARTPSPTRETRPSATSTRAATPSGPTPTLTLVASATTLAVLVQPDGTTVPVEIIQTDDGASSTNLFLFGGLVAVATGAGAVVWIRNRKVM